jgi:hypothetical protein
VRILIIGDVFPIWFAAATDGAPSLWKDDPLQFLDATCEVTGTRVRVAAGSLAHGFGFPHFWQPTYEGFPVAKFIAFGSIRHICLPTWS